MFHNNYCHVTVYYCIINRRHMREWVTVKLVCLRVCVCVCIAHTKSVLHRSIEHPGTVRTRCLLGSICVHACMHVHGVTTIINLTAKYGDLIVTLITVQRLMTPYNAPNTMKGATCSN